MKNLKIDGYELREELYYDALTDMWVEVQDGIAKVGYDPLGLEINGTLAQLAISPVGTVGKRGEQIGTLEAEKFVGPIVMPLSGTLAEVNGDVLANVSAIHRNPYDSWIFAIDFSDPGELTEFVTGEQLSQSFALRLNEYRNKGVLSR